MLISPDDKDLSCGLDGKDDDPVLTGRFNRWIAFAIRHHLVPLKLNIDMLGTSIERSQAMLEQHIRDEESMLRKVLVVTILTLFGTVVGLVVYIWQWHLER